MDVDQLGLGVVGLVSLWVGGKALVTGEMRIGSGDDDDDDEEEERWIDGWKAQVAGSFFVALGLVLLAMAVKLLKF